MLDYILKASDPNSDEGRQEIRVARILLYKVFYDHTESGILPFIFRLMKTFDIHKQPRRCIKTLDHRK
jgi:timeless